ncbi:hypothetical protein K438DRAFT_1018692 [Mycena galopus ATCC 62051]|nr:hypothetical protein K438DRAFT_1018692 [Mycena galopus ATCC 62051]
MAESSPAPAKPTARSSAIHNSANLLHKLIESEVSHAIKPYQDAVDALQRQLNAQRNAMDSKHVEMELSALKAALEVSGLTLVASGPGAGDRPVLGFAGETGKIMTLLEEDIKLFSPDREKVLPVTPAEIVKVLAEGLAEYQRRLDNVYKLHANAVAEQDDLKKQLTQRQVATEEEMVRWDAERTRLDGVVLEEQKKVKALTTAIGAFQTQLQELSARDDSNLWKAKHEAVEAERDSLKLSLGTAGEILVSTQTDLDTWKSKCFAAQADLKTLADNSEKNLRIIQAGVDRWKTQCLQGEADLKTAREGRERDLAAAQSDLDMWKGKCLVAEGNLEITKDESDGKLRTCQAEVEEWKTNYRRVEAQLQTAEDAKSLAESLQKEKELSLLDAQATLETELKTAQTELAGWAAKAAAWATERTRYKTKLNIVETERDRLKQTLEEETTQIAAKNTALAAELEDMRKENSHNASLVIEFRNKLPNLEAQFKAVEMERDELKRTLQKDNDRALAKNTALAADLEDMRKKLRNASLNRTNFPNLESELKAVETERDELKKTLQEDNAKAFAKNTALAAELEDVRKKLTAATGTALPKVPSHMFITPKRNPAASVRSTGQTTSARFARLPSTLRIRRRNPTCASENLQHPVRNRQYFESCRRSIVIAIIPSPSLGPRRRPARPLVRAQERCDQRGQPYRKLLTLTQSPLGLGGSKLFKRPSTSALSRIQFQGETRCCPAQGPTRAVSCARCKWWQWCRCGCGCVRHRAAAFARQIGEGSAVESLILVDENPGCINVQTRYRRRTGGS